MSTLHGKWSTEDVRKVIQSLDEKTGMNGASIHISLCRTLGDGSTLGTYHPSNDHSWRSFSFSLAYFNDINFKDLAAIDVIMLASGVPHPLAVRYSRPEQLGTSTATTWLMP